MNNFDENDSFISMTHALVFQIQVSLQNYVWTKLNQMKYGLECTINLNQLTTNLNESMYNMNEIRPCSKWNIKQIDM